MSLPFSHEAFLDVFGAYNSQLWPAVLLIWTATALVVWTWLRRGGVSRRLLFVLLAVHWAWSGIAYHWLFFRSINPAATIFSVLFLLQAALFVRLSVGAHARIIRPAGVRGAVGVALIGYGLVYPFIGLAWGLEYPRLPLFAVPCPTTLVTAGCLISVGGIPRAVAVVPALWAIVGSSAAFVLGIRADMALVIVAALLVVNLVAPSVLGAESAPS